MPSTAARAQYVKSDPGSGPAKPLLLGLLCLGAALGAAAPARGPGGVSAPIGVTAPAAPAPSAPVPNAAIPRPAELQRDVNFWIRVYSEISTNEGFLHDEWDLSIIYARLQFAPDAQPRTRSDAVDETRDRYVTMLKRLAAHQAAAAAKSAATAATGATAATAATAAADGPLSPDEQRVLALWGDRATSERLLEAARAIRFQLGQADRFRAGLIRSGAWEAHIAETLANLGLPPELAALPHVESSFNPDAYSKVGAAGLWQFMRSTGRRYMRIDDAVDERLDPFRSTEAAAQLLSYNYRVLGTWPLALTAYNHGAAGMRRAKEAVGTDDFVTIARRFRGPTFGFASRNFYPSFLAALTIDQNPERYFPGVERAPEQRFFEVEMPGYARLASIERAAGVARNQLRALNPALRPPVYDGKRFVPRGYKLRLPQSQGELTKETLAARLGAGELYAAQIVERTHRVRRGQTLAAIAQRYGVSQRTLAELNGLGGTRRVRPGLVLRLPETRPQLLAAANVQAGASPGAVPSAEEGAGAAAASTSSTTTAPTNSRGGSSSAAGPAALGIAGGGAESIHIVRGGDTLFGIAARYGLTPAELMRNNRIREPDFIFEGQRLRVARAVAPPAAEESVDEDGGALTASLEPVPGADAQESSPLTASRSGPATRRGSRATPEPPRPVEPVSAAQAEAQSPSVGPGAGVPAAADATDLSVAADNTIRVIAEETLGHYADWLGISASRLRELNRLKYGQAVLLGRKLKLDFARVGKSDFEQKRREFHGVLQSRFFEQRRILGTEVYIVRRGDSLWSITQRYAGVPVWLLQQYNPDLDLAELRAGAQLIVPKLESTVAGA